MEASSEPESSTEARRAKGGSVLHFWLHPHNLGATCRAAFDV